MLFNIGNGNPHVCEETGIMRYADRKEKKKLFLSKQEKQVHEIAIHLLSTDFSVNLGGRLCEQKQNRILWQANTQNVEDIVL